VTGTPRASSADNAFAAIVLSSQDAVIAKTVDGVITSWNVGASEIYGYTAEQAVGRSVAMTIRPQDWPSEQARYARVAAGQPQNGVRCVRVRADGRAIDVVLSMSPLRDDDGAVVGIASIARPVSDKERADERFASLLDAAPDAMVCVDTDGLIVVANAQAGAAFGYPRGELVGRPVEMLLPAGLAEPHRLLRAQFALDPQARAMGSGLALEARRRDGTTFAVEVSLAPGGGTEDLVIAAVRDVSAQRETEAALRESEERLRQLAENVETVFTLRQVDPPAYLYVSPGYERLTGYDPAGLLDDPGRSADLIHPDDLVVFVGSRFGEPEVGDEPEVVEFRIVRADGAVRWVRSASRAVPVAPGTPRRMVTSTEDITERVEAGRAMLAAEASARAANEAKNEFLSRMSHELRTPLNAVLGFSQLLERQLAATEHVESVRYVLQAGRHLLDLINEVLDISAIESGAVSLSPEPVEVSSIIDETVRLMRPVAERTSVVVAVAGGPERAYVLADRLRLRQILLNLISNAIKYNHAGGNVWLTWSSAGGRSVIVVRDDGPGIPAHLHGRLFTAFDRLGAESTDVEGTGVGLTVTKGLVEIMHGEITFDSVVGRGTTFAVALPAATATSTHVHEPGGRDGPAAGPLPAAATMLYIEDNEPNVRVMEAMLALRPAWTLVHAALGTLGIEIARAQLPDLVMLDLHLPDKFGLDVLVALQADPATAAIPVVVLSADASPRQEERLLAAGATAYLTKPLDLDEILALLDGVARTAGAAQDVLRDVDRG